MADAFWNFATSSWMLGIDGLILAAALIVGYIPLGKYMPVIGPYVPVAKLISFLMAALICFLIGFRISDEREEAKSLKIQLAAKQVDLEAANDAAEQAQMARDELAKQAQSDQERIADYAEQLKKRPNGACTLSPDDFSSGVPNR